MCVRWRSHKLRLTLTLQYWQVPVPINHTYIKTSVLICIVSGRYALVLVQSYVWLCPATWQGIVTTFLTVMSVITVSQSRRQTHSDLQTCPNRQKYQRGVVASDSKSPIHFSKRQSYVTSRSSIYNILMDSPTWSKSAKHQQLNSTTYSIGKV